MRQLRKIAVSCFICVKEPRLEAFIWRRALVRLSSRTHRSAPFKLSSSFSLIREKHIVGRRASWVSEVYRSGQTSLFNDRGLPRIRNSAG